MIELLNKLFTITGHKMKTDSMETLAHDIFCKLDVDHNQSISKEEFMNGCIQHESIRQVLSPFEKDYPPKEYQE